MATDKSDRRCCYSVSDPVACPASACSTMGALAPLGRRPRPPKRRLAASGSTSCCPPAGRTPKWIRHCRPELLRKDCYEAVFEAVKGLGARLREKSGLDEDGRALVQAALRGKQPRVLITAYSTVTERNEQEGVALLAEGVFAAFRNPAAHEPRLEWEVSEQDALDVLGTLVDDPPPPR